MSAHAGSSGREPTVFAQAIGIAVATASVTTGRPSELVWASLGADVAPTADPTGRAPHGLVVRVWSELSEGIDDFGLRAARLGGERGQSLVEYAVTTAPRLGDALETFTRLSKLLHEASAHRLELGPKEAVLRLSLRPPWRLPGVLWEFLTARVAQRLVRLVGEAGRPASVALPRGPFDDEAAAQAAFGVPVDYRAPEAAIRWPREALALPLIAPDAPLHFLLTRRLDAELGSSAGEPPREAPLLVGEEDPLIAARRALRAAVLGGDPSLAALARRLHQSPRSLQRALLARGTSYQALLDEARRAVALSLLREHGASIKQAALTTGFAHAAAFTRAFRRWTGLAPAAYLRRHASGDPLPGDASRLPRRATAAHAALARATLLSGGAP